MEQSFPFIRRRLFLVLSVSDTSRMWLFDLSRDHHSASGSGKTCGWIDSIQFRYDGATKIIHRTWESIETELNAYTNSFPLTTKATIVACPTTHSFGLLCGVFATLRRGATPVILQDFSPRHVLAIHRLHPDAIIYMAPGLAYAMSLFPESVHAVMISGMTLPEKWFRSIERKTHHLLQQYGCSEIGCIALHPNPPSPQAIGFPLEHLEIETGTKGKPAELVVSQQGVRIGTKDLMYVEDGLHFLSRLDEMINVSGLSVYPGKSKMSCISFRPSRLSSSLNEWMRSKESASALNS